MQQTFKQVAERYGLLQPDQVKLRIIWNNVKALVTQQYGPDQQNDQLLKRYEQDFKAAETEENLKRGT